MGKEKRKEDFLGTGRSQMARTLNAKFSSGSGLGPCSHQGTWRSPGIFKKAALKKLKYKGDRVREVEKGLGMDGQQ